MLMKHKCIFIRLFAIIKHSWNHACSVMYFFSLNCVLEIFLYQYKRVCLSVCSDQGLKVIKRIEHTLNVCVQRASSYLSLFSLYLCTRGRIEFQTRNRQIRCRAYFIRWQISLNCLPECAALFTVHTLAAVMCVFVTPVFPRSLNIISIFHFPVHCLISLIAW